MFFFHFTDWAHVFRAVEYSSFLGSLFGGCSNPPRGQRISLGVMLDVIDLGFVRFFAECLGSKHIAQTFLVQLFFVQVV